MHTLLKIGIAIVVATGTAILYGFSTSKQPHWEKFNQRKKSKKSKQPENDDDQSAHEPIYNVVDLDGKLLHIQDSFNIEERTNTLTSEEKTWRDSQPHCENIIAAPPPAALESILWQGDAELKKHVPLENIEFNAEMSDTWLSEEMVALNPVPSTTVAAALDANDLALEDEIAKMDKAMSRIKERREHLELLRNQSVVSQMSISNPSTSRLENSQAFASANQSLGSNELDCFADQEDSPKQSDPADPADSTDHIDDDWASENGSSSRWTTVDSISST